MWCDGSYFRLIKSIQNTTHERNLELVLMQCIFNKTKLSILISSRHGFDIRSFFSYRNKYQPFFKVLSRYEIE